MNNRTHLSGFILTRRVRLCIHMSTYFLSLGLIVLNEAREAELAIRYSDWDDTRPFQLSGPQVWQTNELQLGPMNIRDMRLWRIRHTLQFRKFEGTSITIHWQLPVAAILRLPQRIPRLHYPDHYLFSWLIKTCHAAPWRLVSDCLRLRELGKWMAIDLVHFTQQTHCPFRILNTLQVPASIS